MTEPIGQALVITASTRASQGVYPDRAGPIVADGLRALGFSTDDPLVVADGDPVEQALRDAVAAAYDVVVTTGGTGISPTDQTADRTRRLIDREVPGIAEAIRADARGAVAAAVLSRGLAGVAGRTLIVNLPGSPGGARDGIAVLSPILRHAVEQIRGVDHVRGGHAHAHAPDGAGTTGQVVLAEITEQPLSEATHAELVRRSGAGAVVSFAGIVRDHDADRPVRELEYVGHPNAAEVIAAVAAEVAVLPHVQAVAVSHRIGTLAVGEVALACAVSTAHRAEAFEACQHLVDTVKERLPVWKRQLFADGQHEWVACA